MANVTLTPVVRDILERSTVTDNVLFLPKEQLERPVYEAVNKALVAAGGKWNRSKAGHIFKSDPRQLLGLILEQGHVVDTKKQLQAFFTPRGLADRMAEIAGIDGHNVLEPSAGHGALADACMRAGAARVDCCELSEEFSEVLRGKQYDVQTGDFLAMERTGFLAKQYDRILMNPPFTKDQDVKHVKHALRYLAGGGVLASVMGANTSRKSFQSLVEDLDYEITPLAAGEFKESGTSVATIVLRVMAPQRASVVREPAAKPSAPAVKAKVVQGRLF
jgi:predicted RNA methylase